MARKSAFAVWLPLLFIVVGALVWKLVLGRDFTWAAIGSPPAWRFGLGIGVGVVALAVIFMLRKRQPR